MCPKFTYFGPDVRGTLVEGCDFHKFYFDQGELSHLPPTLLMPKKGFIAGYILPE